MALPSFLVLVAPTHLTEKDKKKKKKRPEQKSFDSAE